MISLRTFVTLLADLKLKRTPLSHLYLVGLSKKLGFKFQHLTIQTLTLLSFSRNCRQMETYEMIVVDGRFLPVQRDWFARRDM